MGTTLNILDQLVTQHLKNGKLPFFFYTSLPSSLVSVPFSVDTNLKLKDCCLAGGHIFKQVYKLNYESDIDIWTSKFTKDDFRNTFKLNDKHDIIVKPRNPYTSISTCDLSVCQQGIVYDIKGKKELHVTPLSLYSYYTKIIIVTRLPLKRKYDSDYSSDYAHEKSVEDYYESHVGDYGAYTHDVPFHRCDICMEKWHEKDEEFNYIRRWILRIQKYEKRLPLYKILYTGLPYSLQKSI
jgi:hypothetical protein